MDHDHLIGQVQARARLGSRGEAETATRATLETIAERIPAGLADNLAARLPTGDGEHLRRVTTAPDRPTTGVRMEADEFYDRVAQRAGEDPRKAAQEARCVREVVGEAVEGRMTDKLRESVGPELSRTLFAGSAGTA
ncbi:DUF2267 domain-containing protein [Streptomyces sp. NPDC058664]|uniref:DUF2267 domain-containing protein n=1 Tax=unclassified Streptomyces TaxID=2593676 RepID=UPI00365861BB